MKLAALSRNFRKHPADCVFYPFVGIGSDHQHTTQSALSKACKEVVPTVLCFAIIDSKAKDFADAIAVDAICNHESPRNNPVLAPYFEISGIHSNKRIVIRQRAITEFCDSLIQVFTQV